MFELIPFETLLLFLGAGVLLNLTPGADVMLAIAVGIRGGWRHGVAAAFGVSIGGLVHVLLATLGLSALLLSLPHGFDIVRGIGICYLLYLAVTTWRASAASLEKASEMTMTQAWVRGFMTSALNPKVALFILAFLPQFTDPANGPVWAQMLLLGAVFATTGFAVTATYGALAGVFGAKLVKKTEILNKLSAFVFGALALRLAWN